MKAVAGLSILGVLIGLVDFGQLVQTFAGAAPLMLLLGATVFALATVFEVARLHALLGVVPWRQTMRLVLAGTFLSNFLPGNVGGDVYKVYSLNRGGSNFGTALTMIVGDRVLSLGVLVVAGALFLLLGGAPTQPMMGLSISGFGSRHLWLIVLSAAVGAGAGGAVVIRLGALRRLRAKIQRLGAQIGEAIAAVTRPQLMLSTGHSVIFHSCRVAGFYWLIESFGEHATISQLYVVSAGVMLISLLPLTLGAVGVREGAFVMLLGMYGVSAPAALSVALIVRAVMWAKSLAGGAVVIWPELLATLRGVKRPAA